MRDAAFQSVAIGVFDGVHIGHRQILAGADVALTFSRHPLSILAPARAPRLIMTLEDRLAAIRACGVRNVRVLEFTRAFAALEPDAFLNDYLAEFAVIRCGANARFGRDGAGDADFLRARGKTVHVVPYAVWQGEAVSSSRIRAALSAGDLGAANAMLGRAYARSGTVFRGKGEGSRLGFPTINVHLADEGLMDLPRGAYVVRVGAARGVANWGVAPTMRERAWTAPTLEVHLLDGAPMEPASADGALTVQFDRFLRPERTFASCDELKRQIAADCAEARA